MAYTTHTNITGLSISYPDFQWGAIVNPDEVDINNGEISAKINTIIDTINDKFNSDELPFKDSTVTTRTIKPLAITTEKLNDLAVTDAKISVISQSKVNSTTGWINTAITTSNTNSSTALTNSNNAVSTSNNANTNASIALNTANSADAKSNTAITNSNTAITTANNAMTMATDVQADYNIKLPEITAGIDSIALKVDKTYVDDTIASLVIGAVPDGSITRAKMSTEVNASFTAVDGIRTDFAGVQSDVTSLKDKVDLVTPLTTTAQTVVPAINELKTSLDTKVEASAINDILTPQGILDKVKQVDGAGSGLDADKISGRNINEIVRFFPLTTATASFINTKDTPYAYSASVDCGTEIGLPSQHYMINYYPYRSVDGYGVQTALSYTGGLATEMYTRNAQGVASWNPWRRLLNQTDYDALFQSVVNGKQAVVNSINGSIGYTSGLTTGSTHADYAWWISNKLKPMIIDKSKLIPLIPYKQFTSWNAGSIFDVDMTDRTILTICGTVFTQNVTFYNGGYQFSAYTYQQYGTVLLRITSIQNTGVPRFDFPIVLLKP